MNVSPRQLVAYAVVAGLSLSVASAAERWEEEVRLLREQNQTLQEQLKNQQRVIQKLQEKVDRLDSRSEEAGAASPATESRAAGSGIRLAAEISTAFFHGRSGTLFPNSEFRIDDARVSLEAPILNDVYFYGEMELLTRESADDAFHLGEFYVEFEELARSWGEKDLLNVRVGRVNIPFGEEYQVRRPMDNPLVSHSLADIWGIDEGLEVYGRKDRWSYVLAVQNGGHSALHDFHKDKSLTGRLSFQATDNLAVSASAMRTGRLTVPGDGISEVWLGNTWLVSIQPSPKVGWFEAQLFEGDARLRWKQGALALMYGAGFYDDIIGAADDRTFRFGSAELTQDFTENVYGAARYSWINVANGYPLWGWAGTRAIVDRMTRTSVGLGYRMGRPLLLKLEYTWENSRAINGTVRGRTDMLSSELAVRF